MSLEEIIHSSKNITVAYTSSVKVIKQTVFEINLQKSVEVHAVSSAEL